MKKIVVFLVVLCAFATSAFAAVTISDWGISRNNHNAKPIVYEGLVEDIAPSGFTVHAAPEMWDATPANPPWIYGNIPWVGFQSNNISPGLMINYDDATSFDIGITGFDDFVLSDWAVPRDNDDRIRVIFWSTDNKYVSYETPWDGDGLYKFGYDQIVNYEPQTSDFEVNGVILYLGGTSTVYRFADNTTGTIDFIFPDAEVPEPSSLLALAFGGAGIAGFAFRRR